MAFPIDDRLAALVLPAPPEHMDTMDRLTRVDVRIARGSAVLARLAPDGEYRFQDDGSVEVWFEGNINNAVNLRHFGERVACARKRMILADRSTAYGRIRPDNMVRVGTVDLDRGVICDMIHGDLLEMWAEERLDRFYPLMVRPGAGRSAIDRLGRGPGQMIYLPPQVWQSANGQIIFQERMEAEPEIMDHDTPGFPERMRALGVPEHVIRICCGREAVLEES